MSSSVQSDSPCPEWWLSNTGRFVLITLNNVEKQRAIPSALRIDYADQLKCKSEDK